MNSSTNRTARESFDANRGLYASIQKRLDARMTARASQFASQSYRWDLVADEDRILHYLALALAAAGDRSGVDELGIEY